MAARSDVLPRRVRDHVNDSAALVVVDDVLDLFPGLRPDLTLTLLTALLRLTNGVPFLSRVMGADLAARLQRAIQQERSKGSFLVARHVAADLLMRTSPIIATLIAAENSPQKGTERLRACLWICMARWRMGGKAREGVLTDFASALRGAVAQNDYIAIQKHGVANLLSELGAAASFEDFVEAANAFRTSNHKNMRAVWRHVGPELTALLTRVEPISAKARPPRRRFTRDDNEALEVLISRSRRVSTPRLDVNEPLLPGEPTAEVSFITTIAPLVPSANNPDSQALAEYHARQVVWNQNALLLTNHPDVLHAPIYQRVLQVLLEALKSQQKRGLHLGFLGLLLQGITGKTTQSLLSISLVNDFALAPAHACELCLQNKALRLKVFFANESNDPNGYFRPTEEQQTQLEPVEDAFLLPLPDAVVDAVRQVISSAELRHLDVDTFDRWIRAAVRRVSQIVGLPITAGQVRRSFSAHLFDLCRDTASVQLVCADTLGQSEAPLHYYSPRVGDVAKAYWTLLTGLTGSTERFPAHFGLSARVGSRLLLKLDVAKTLVQTLQAAFPRTNTGSLMTIHNAMTAHLAAMFMATAGHRPVNALFRLTLGDIDLESGAGLFKDKVHDPAQNPRLTALPSMLVRQIGAYLSHLQALALKLPKLAARVNEIMDGKSPLLFRLRNQTEWAPFEVATLKRALPCAWTQLPLNWGRTWIRTRAVESGMSPELASIQLGHLDAIGHPFSNASPTEPRGFVDVARPYLDTIAAQQGWRVHDGLGKKSVPAVPLPPLRAWASEVSQHEQEVRHSQRFWNDSELARMRGYQREAESYILTHSLIQETRIGDFYARRCSSDDVRLLLKDEADAFCDRLIDEAAPNVALGLARANVLYRILRRVNERAGLKDQDPNQRLAVWRPVNNAFVPGMMVAVRQVCALREHATYLGGQSPGDWRDFTLACARVSYVLAVFGFCDDPDQIEGALKYRHQLVRAESFDDVVLVRWGPEPEQTFGVRSLAALAVARLAKKYPDQDVPRRDQLNGALSQLLPPWASVPTGKTNNDLLTVLCETVAVSNRYELSPAARMALDIHNGSVSAHPLEQVALLDGYPAHALERTWETELPDDDRTRIPITTTGSRAGNARSQYLALCSVIPQFGKDLELPLTGASVPAHQLIARSTRQQVIAEVRAQLDEQSPARLLHPIVRLLATWVLDMLENGTQKKRHPADRTIATYLTRIGGRLVETFGQRSLEDLDDAQLEEAYRAIIESGQNTLSRVIAILSFHDCCTRYFVFPELDLSDVRSYLRSSHRGIDTALVRPHERDAAVQGLFAETLPVEMLMSQNKDAVRVVRQAAAAMPFYAYAGVRRSEPLGLRLSDLTLDGGIAAARIRGNPSRRLKTSAARRTINLSAHVPKEALARISDWIAKDASRLAKWRSEQAYVFSPLADGRLATGRTQIAQTCVQALREVTGRVHERLHRLRHLAAYGSITPVALSEADYSVWSKQHGACHVRPTRLALPRDFAGPAATLGHAQASTTVQSYHHLPWLFRSRPDEHMNTNHIHRRTVAFALGITTVAVDKIRREGTLTEQPSHPIRKWLDHVLLAKPAPQTTQLAPEPLATALRPWTASDLGHMLTYVERAERLVDALILMGAHSGEEARIRRECESYEKRLGRRLIADDPSSGSDRPCRAVRHLTQADGLTRWWSQYDEGNSLQRAAMVQVAERVFDLMKPRDKRGIKMCAQTAPILIGMLQDVLPDAVVERTHLESGVELICATAPTGRGAARDTSFHLPIKRALGVIWLAHRLSQCAGRTATHVV